MFLQKTSVQFPPATWWLTTTHITSLRGSETLFCLLRNRHTWCTYMYIVKTLIQIKSRKKKSTKYLVTFTKRKQKIRCSFYYLMSCFCYFIHRLLNTILLSVWTGWQCRHPEISWHTAGFFRIWKIGSSDFFWLTIILESGLVSQMFKI